MTFGILSTPASEFWDLTTATFDTGQDQTVSVNAQDTIPQDVRFSPDGSQFFMVGESSDSVYRYTCTTPWDLTTATFDTGQTVSVTSQDTSPLGFDFSPDGSQFFVMGNNTGSVYRYTCATPWDLTTATFDTGQTVSVAAQDTNPRGFDFSPDGSQFFVMGNSTDSVYRYTCPTPWDMTTATFDTGQDQTVSVSAQDTTPEDIRFSPDGSQFFMVGSTTDSVYRYTCATPWDLTTVSFDTGQTVSVSAQETNPTGVDFSPDGSQFFVMGASSDSVYRYTCATPWDLTTATFDTGQTVSVTSQDILPTGIDFNPDGSQFFVMGGVSESVYRYTCATPWDLTTATFDTGGDQTASVNAQDTITQDVRFSPDGSKFFMVGESSDSVYRYTCTTPWDLTTATFDTGQTVSVSAQDILPTGIDFNPDGSQFFMVGYSSDSVYRYTCTTPWDLTTATFDTGQTASVSAQDGSPSGVDFSPDGSQFFVMGASSYSVYRYTCATPWDLTTATFDTGQTVSVFAQDTNPQDLYLRQDGSQFFIIGAMTDSIYRYSMG